MKLQLVKRADLTSLHTNFFNRGLWSKAKRINKPKLWVELQKEAHASQLQALSAHVEWIKDKTNPVMCFAPELFQSCLSSSTEKFVQELLSVTQNCGSYSQGSSWDPLLLARE